MFNLNFGNPKLKRWKAFANVDFTDTQIVLAHIFGTAGESVIFINSFDEVFALGDNYLGCLGVEGVESSRIPVEIPELSKHLIRGICTGDAHGLAYSESGELYSWGYNGSGQLGNITVGNRSLPEQVGSLQNEIIISAIAGSTFSLALTNSFEVWIWGELPSLKRIKKPMKLSFPKEEDIIYITNGLTHIMALSNSGKLYSWGNGDDGKLGHGNKTSLAEPKLVNIPDKIIKVACGRDCTLAINESGTVYAWGNNSDGCLSIEAHRKAIFTPTIVPIRERITDIAGTIYHQLLAAENEETGNIFIWGKCEGILKFASPQSIHCNSLYDAFCDFATPVTVKQMDGFTDSEEDGDYESVANIDLKVGGNSVILVERHLPVDMFDNKEMSDVTIKLSGETCINAHKVILNFFSQHFRKMFQDQWKECVDCILDMSNYNPIAYSAYIKFVYTGIMEELEATDLFDLYLIAKEYEEDTLADECLTNLGKRISVENVAILFANAWKSQCQDMIKMCVTESAKSFDDVILTAGFANFTNEERLYFCQLTATERKSQYSLTNKCKSIESILE